MLFAEKLILHIAQVNYSKRPLNVLERRFDKLYEAFVEARKRLAQTGGGPREQFVISGAVISFPYFHVNGILSRCCSVVGWTPL